MPSLPGPVGPVVRVIMASTVLALPRFSGLAWWFGAWPGG